MFAEAIQKILDDACTPAVVRKVEAGASPGPLWEALSDAGFLELLAPEDEGGAGLPLPDLFPIFRHFGSYAVPLPIAQTIAARGIVGGRLSLPPGMITLANNLTRGADGTVSCAMVPFGMVADHVLAADGDGLTLLPMAAAQRCGSGIHNSQMASLSWSAQAAVEHCAGGAHLLHSFGAALHAAMLTGAMVRVFEMTLQYCNDRVQFGKSLGKFQAIQHQLSAMAEHIAAASIAAEAAFQNNAQAPGLLAAAIAKSRSSEAALLVANTAHALHGAIGITEEYDLQLLTRRLHEWRMAHGSEGYWNQWIGQEVLASGSRLCDFVQTA